MAIKTKYVCDRCGHEQEKPEQMWEVSIGRKHLDYFYGSSPDTAKSAQWCRGCMEFWHILPAVTKPAVIAPIPPTIEDLIREIIREEINNNEHN